MVDSQLLSSTQRPLGKRDDFPMDHAVLAAHVSVSPVPEIACRIRCPMVMQSHYHKRLEVQTLLETCSVKEMPAEAAALNFSPRAGYATASLLHHYGFCSQCSL